ncbi:MAG: HD domain-containing phosphohydrolase [Anaerolineaceae bacterium]
MDTSNLYKTAFDNFYLAQCIISEGIILDSNTVFDTLYSIEQSLPSKYIRDYINPQFIKIFENNIQDIQEYKSDYIITTLPFRVSSNGYRDFEMHLSVLLNGESRNTFLITFYDIEKTRNLELIETEQRTIADVLRDISATLNSNLDFDTILEKILEQMARVVPYDSASIMLLDKDQETARIYAAKGLYDQRGLLDWRKEGILLVSKTPILRRMFLSGLPLVVPDTTSEPNWVITPQTAWINSFAGAPIKSRSGTIIGFLSLNSPIKNYFSYSAVERLQAFTDQAGIALFNARLLRDLKQSNIDLLEAYENTLQGWSKALEYRDEDTEGHTQRVTDITMALCSSFGIKEPALTKIRYGALLHDIGKLGIPDAVLNKPGKLTSEEWAIMQKHPELGHEMLKDIPFLRGSLDIPYSHHERWDGTGYPLGLKGEEIPIAARIFCVVDVWDAIVSKRPYHDSRSTKEAVRYIKEEAGKHFDPEVVNRFLYLLEQKHMI